MKKQKPKKYKIAEGYLCTEELQLHKKPCDRGIMPDVKLRLRQIPKNKKITLYAETKD